MPVTVTPSGFVRPGAVVLVVKSSSTGPVGWMRREVAKVNAQHFTVEGVVPPGANQKPVRFRNKAGMAPGGLPFSTVAHEAAAENLDWYVIEDGTEAARIVRAKVDERAAVLRTERAARAWQEVEGRRTSITSYDNRPTPAEVDEALVELAAAAVELRRVLGVPDGAETAGAAS